jgi:hypothetical protein
MNAQELSAKEKLLRDIHDGWIRLQAFLQGYSDQQLTTPTDAASWTAKDHIVHLALWEGSMIAVMDRKPRWEYMGISKAVWATLATGSYDAVNDALQKKYRVLSLDEVRRELETRHQQFIERIENFPEDELHLPYNHFQPLASDETYPLIDYFSGNSYDHYNEHIPWIGAIIKST